MNAIKDNRTLTEAALPGRTAAVKKLFDANAWYLQRWRCVIQTRAETVAEMTGNKRFQSILDIGCGDGSISIQLLRSGTKLTLNDLSKSMLDTARAAIPGAFTDHVECLNEDFSSVALHSKPFDLILCLGVLAHIASPPEAVAKIVPLLASSGTVIVECTDADHFVTRVLNFVGDVQGIFRPKAYALNRVTAKGLVQIFESQGFRFVSGYRHQHPFLGMSRIFSQNFLYRLNRRIFGTVARNRNAWLGNQCILQFERNEGASKD